MTSESTPTTKRTPVLYWLLLACAAAAVVAASFIPVPEPPSVDRGRAQAGLLKHMPIRPGESLTYHFAWTSATMPVSLVCADGTVRTEERLVDGRRHLVASFEGGTRAVLAIWKYRLEGETLVDQDTLLPVESRWTSHNRDRTKHLTARFNRAKGILRVKVEKPYKNSTSRKVIDLPPDEAGVGMGLDIPSGVLMARCVDLQIGATVRYQVLHKDKTILLSLTPVRTETLKVQAGEYEALVVDVGIEPVAGADEDEKQDAAEHRGLKVWISTDEARLPLKMQVDVPVGMIVAELVSVQR